MSHRRSVALVLLSAIGFGSMALFANAAYASGVTPSTLLALRFLLAALMLAPVVWMRGWQLPRGRVLAGYMLMGCMYTAQSQSYFNALLYASSGLVGMLLYVYPVLVTALALALGWEKMDRRMLVLMLVAVGGMAVTLGGKLQGQPIGIALALLAAGIYACYILIGNRLSQSRQDTHPLAACVVIMATAAVTNTGLALWHGVALPASANGWLAVAAIALFSTAVAIACFLAGVNAIGAAQASILSTLEPVVTLGLGVAMLHETVSASQLLGGALVLTAVVLLAQRAPARPAAIAAASGA
ncbi:DMT family transporter [Janthinobacterium fluminis]|uniref:DMT family transporter n=1 Tax=Janthinobacterium fluminis TaxID=2987524 RepID=A0ABT5K8U0_9BURK|nr:DMT family transporter [Janthinobacterium fluminis]MDC8760511.1 DMT family transporter [Janthinobacterium fluminis]